MLLLDDVISSNEDPGPLPGPRHTYLLYGTIFATNTANLANFNMASKVQIVTVLNETLTVTLTC